VFRDVINRCIVVLFGSFFHQGTHRQRHNVAVRNTPLAPVQLLPNWLEQRPSNKGDLDRRVTGKVGREYCTDVVFDLFFCFIVRRSCFGVIFLNGTPCVRRYDWASVNVVSVVHSKNPQGSYVFLVHDVFTCHSC
jgi:hypothetical protein